MFLHIKRFVLTLIFIFLVFVPWICGLGVQMQFFSYYLHPFNFYSCLLLSYNFLSMFIALSCFLACFIVLQLFYCFLNLFYYFDVVGLAFLVQDMYKFLVCALCHVRVLLAMFMCLDLYVWKLCLVLLQLYTSCLCLSLVSWLLGRMQMQIQWSRSTKFQ